MSADALQHRIYLGPCRPGGDPREAHRYWRESHRQTVRGTDHLLGYVQNRPLAAWWDRVPFLVCAETWFATRADEAAFYEADYFFKVIVPDEERIIDRDASWNSAVAGVDVLTDGDRATWRVMSFGGPRERFDDALAGFSRAEVLQLRRPVPGQGDPHVLSAWTDDAGAAADLAGRLGGLTFVANPVPVVAPPVRGWDLAHEDAAAFAG